MTRKQQALAALASTQFWDTTRHPADEKVIVWLDRQPRSSIWTTSITLLELYYGLQIMAAGRKRSALMQRLETLVMDKLDRRMLPLR